MRKYSEPKWSPAAGPILPRTIDVVKNGSLLESICLGGRGFFVVGRTPESDIQLDHPSISRQHAVFQHRKNGALYIHDLSSTHGTYLNKERLEPDLFHELKDGDFLKFGASSRMFFMKIEKPLIQDAPSKNLKEEGSAAECVEKADSLALSSATSQNSSPHQGTCETRDVVVDSSVAFEGNAEEYKRFVASQKRAGGKRAASFGDKKLLKDTGFDLSDGFAAKKRKKKSNDDMDFNEIKGAFGVWKPRTGAARDEVDSGDEEDSEDAPEEGEDSEDNNFASKRRFQSIANQADTGFDSDDDFFDRASSSKLKPVHAANRRPADASLTLLELKIRLAALETLLSETSEELNWFIVNVYGADGDAKTAVEQAMAEDTLDSFMTGMIGSVKKEKKELLSSLQSDLKKQIASTKKIITAVTPAMPELAGDAQKNAQQIYDQSKWAEDELVCTFAVKLQECCSGIERKRTKKRRLGPRSGAAVSQKPVAQPRRKFTADQIQAEEEGAQEPSIEIEPSSEQIQAEEEGAQEPSIENEHSSESATPSVEVADTATRNRYLPPQVNDAPQGNKKKKKKSKAAQVPQYDELDSWQPPKF